MEREPETELERYKREADALFCAAALKLSDTDYETLCEYVRESGWL